MPVDLYRLSRSRKYCRCLVKELPYRTNRTYSKLSPKCVKIARPTLFGYIETREEFESYTNELFSLLKSGQLKTKIHKIYPLEEIAQVHKVSDNLYTATFGDSECSLPFTGSGRSEDHWQASSEALIE